MFLRPSFFKGSLTAALAAVLLISSATASPPRLLAWIEVEVTGETVTFTPLASAAEPMAVRYQIKIMRLSKAGSSTTQQGGATTLAGDDRAEPLAKSSISLTGGGALSVELTVTGPDGQEVSALIASPKQSAL